ncbi:MAG: hypothetical protein GXC94_10770 [Comamonadaceae bacterium]|nr:hypothetical protein [Comamonadaceae bacterium]
MLNSAARAMAGRPPFSWRQALLVLMVLAMGVLTGLAAGLGSTLLVILVGSLMVAPWVLLMPTTWMIGLLAFMATVGFGCLQYFGRVNQAHWIPTLLLAALLIRATFDGLRIQPRSQAAPFVNPLAACLLAFVAVVLVSALTNASDPMQVLVGFRHYLFPLALVMAVLNCGAPERFWLQIFRGIPWLMLLQLPLCFYQYFFVEKARGAKVFGAVGIAWDAVVGSFGGNPDGGGASGALAVFLSFGIAATLILRRQGLIGPRMAWASIAAALLCSVLAEIKVLVIFLPLALLLVQRRQILGSPIRLAGWALGAVLLAVALQLAYQSLHYGASQKRVEESWTEKLDRLSRFEQDTRFFNRLTGEVSRVGGLLLWSDEHLARTPGPRTWVGWGPAASKSSTLFGVGPAARSHEFSLTTSSATQLLWDLGLVGLLLFGGACALGVGQGLRQARRLGAGSGGRVALAELSALGCLLVLAGLLYNGDAVNSPSVQTLLALCLGLVLWLRRQPAEPGGRVGSPSVAAG